MIAVCYHCGDRPAACYGAYEGAYEGAEIAAAACDICCGHGNEDGWCIQIADMLEREPLVQEVIRLIRAEDDGSDRSGGAHLFAACRLLAEWKP